MKVLVYGFSGKILGGIETFILNMNGRMSNDCIFDYIIDGNDCVYKDIIQERGGNIFYVPRIKKDPIGYLYSFWRLLREQKKRGTNVFYYQLFSMANMVPPIMACLRGYKVVLHAHNNGLQSKGGLYKAIHGIGKYVSHLFPATYFTNSKISSDFMFGKNVESEVIYNAIDLEHFVFNKEIRDRVREEQGSDKRTVVGFVGRLSRQKNPLFMLSVFSEYLRINEQSELWIIGEGELKKDMENVIIDLNLGGHIKWLGRRNDVSLLMNGMDLLLQPSLFEGFGIVLLEAQATGLPVVTSRDVVPEEVAATSLIKFVSLNNNSKYWADQCNHILTEATMQDRNSIKVVSEKYDISKEAVRLEGLLRSTVYDYAV